ncbi:MAG TPA: hypothetical protein VH144_00065, partial [Candidatus Saccharimonadales bacterium]|nr:hypothetical protein [Candidatus Saccharimonadales bacterium]
EVIPKWRQLGEAFTATFTGGLPEQLRQFTDVYIPAIGAGGTMVAQSWKNVKDQFFAFALQAQTVSDVGTVFKNTSATMNVFAAAVQPVSAGLRDIAVVGSGFLRELATAIIPKIANGFAAWAENARQTGSLMRWMLDSVQAAKYLAAGVIDATKAVWNLLTIFKTGTGDNFLKNFADSMHRFNETVKSSSASGVLHQIGEAVRSIGTEKIASFTETMKVVAPVIGQLLKFVGQLGAAFSQTFGPAIATAASILGGILKVINAVGGGAAIGGILGMVAAWKLVGLAMGPVGSLIRIVVGGFNLMRGLDRIVLSAATALENMGSIGAAAADKLVGGFTAVRAAIGIATAAITAALIGFTLYQEGSAEFDAANKSIQNSARHARESIESITDALKKDGSLGGSTVFDAVKQSIDTGLADLDSTANSKVGLLGKFKDQLDTLLHPSEKVDLSWTQILFGFLGDDAKVDKVNNTAKAAENTRNAFDKLGLTSKDLTQALTRGGPAYDNIVNKLKSLGDAGKDAIDWLTKQHDSLQNLNNQMVHAADVGNKLGAAMDKVVQASGNWYGATETLNGALAKLNITSDQLTAAIQGNADGYVKFLKDLSLKQAPQGVVDVIKQMRQQFEGGGQQVKQFADAINKLNDVEVSADEKAQAFVASLKQLGTIPNDEALSKYNDDIDNAIGYQSKLVDMLDRTGNSLVDQSGKLDQSAKNGRTLSATVQQLVQDNVALVESGRASPEEAYAHTSEALKRLFTQFQITDPAAQQKIIDTYFPANAFKEAIKAQDPKAALQSLFKDNPAQLDTSLKLLTTVNDLIHNLLG